MKLLALDTSTEYLSLALWLDGKIFTRDLLAGQTHSQQVLPLLRELLDEAKVSINDLDGIAFGAGPGSFTGLRIGCGVAQGLAFGANLPVVGVSTLLALAQANGSEKVMACMDARMGEIYHAAYVKNNEGWNEVSAVGLSKPDVMPPLAGDGWVGIGNGWQSYAQQLETCYGSQIRQIFPDAHPQAVAIAELARPLFEAGLGQAAAEAAPIYIRNKVAFKTSERELAKSLK
ncbi:MAG TPA: tRNA (adenosine(37)-N6)-threonylcarbamoyltransferase complex dimerization subunit type 1 TsaB [Methylophilaceae bacterium]|nr:tRNA (adenosine(37)-N6)-threonylcarbamoyltransferase complex dimerization subunit type 1 TsaB [Methylophilaceae bacterium]